MAPRASKETSFYFDPNGSGLRIFLGPTEADIMGVLWKQGALTAKRVQFFLGDSPKRAHTTILTILAKLLAKGLVTRKKENRQFVFSPTIKADEFVTKQVGTVLQTLKLSYPKQVKAAS